MIIGKTKAMLMLLKIEGGTVQLALRYNADDCQINDNYSSIIELIGKSADAIKFSVHGSSLCRIVSEGQFIEFKCTILKASSKMSQEEKQIDVTIGYRYDGDNSIVHLAKILSRHVFVEFIPLQMELL